MSLPIVLSDDEDRILLDTPLPAASKKRRSAPDAGPEHQVLIIDDDPTPNKFGSGSAPSFVPETPLSEIAIVKCTSRFNLPEDPLPKVSSDDQRLAGIGGMICLGSDSESDSACERETLRENEAVGNASYSYEDLRREFGYEAPSDLAGDSDPFQGQGRNFCATFQLDEASLKENEAAENASISSENLRREFGYDAPSHLAGDSEPFQWPGRNFSATSQPEEGAHRFQVDQVDSPDKENVIAEDMDETSEYTSRDMSHSNKNTSAVNGVRKRKMSKEERIHAAEEKKLRREQEKLQAVEEKKRQREQKKIHAAEERLKKEQEKLAKKAEADGMKKFKQWEKGKFAQKSIISEIDTKVVELGAIGGHLLTRLSEKGLSFRIKSNPIERSIVWTMSVPEEIAQLSTKGAQVSYVVLVYEAEDFCNLVNGSFLEHVDIVRRLYPSHTICYLTNRLLAFINKREQDQYKNPANSSGWRRPPVEEVLAKLTTHYVGVHHRQCIDEAEVAEHIVGLTSSLASCHFRKKLSRLSVNANGSVIPKDAVDRNLMKNNVWLRALVAIPKVQPRFAIAIWKKYPTMKSLLRVYMDPNKSVYEKERLLKDLVTEGLVSQDRRLGGVCSKRVYRILMARSGSIKTDDVEDGADFFGS